MHISVNGLRLIEAFEGWSSCPYWDGYGGVWTRGYGETESIGPRSKCISRAEGEARLKWLVETRYEWAINNCRRQFTQNEFDALCSFVWNLGPGVLDPGTQMGDLLRAGEYVAAANAMLQYDHAGGVVLEGLQRRREQERALFLDSAPGPHAGVLTTEEAHAVGMFDKLRVNWKRHPVAFYKYRNEIIRLREAIWRAAVKGVIAGHPPRSTKRGWNVNHRGERYNILRSRVK